MLIVRLAAAQAPLHWQLFAPGEPHHEASGRWPTDDASPFPALAEQYPAWVLIPASDCAFHSLTLPAGLRKTAAAGGPVSAGRAAGRRCGSHPFCSAPPPAGPVRDRRRTAAKMRDWLARCESLSLTAPGVDARRAGPAPATAGVERGAGGRAVADPPPAVGRHGGGKRLADGAAAGARRKSTSSTAIRRRPRRRASGGSSLRRHC